VKIALSASRRSFSEGAFGALFALYAVASMTWAFKGDRTLLAFEFIYKLLFPLLLLLLFRKVVPPTKAQLLLALYIALVVYMFAIAMFSEAPMDVAANTVKFLYPLIFFAAALFILNPQNFTIRMLYAIPILGVLGAVQTLTLAGLIYTGHAPPLHILTLIGYKNFPMPTFGIFGYAWGSIALGTPYQVYRAQSYFGEPTRMASFMEIATVISWGLHRCERKRWQLIAAILGCITVVACFSMTADVVAMLTFGFYFVVTRWRRTGYIAPVIALATAGIAVAAVIAYLHAATIFYSESTKTVNLALGHAGTEVSVRQRFLWNSLRLARDHPLGIGVIGVEKSRILRLYPGAGDVIAPLVWLTEGGVIGLIIQLAILGFVFFRVVIPQVIAGGLARYVSLAFVICALHHCVAGDWMDTMFLFLLAAVIALDRYEFPSPNRLTVVLQSHPGNRRTPLTLRSSYVRNNR